LETDKTERAGKEMRERKTTLCKKQTIKHKLGWWIKLALQKERSNRKLHRTCVCKNMRERIHQAI